MKKKENENVNTPSELHRSRPTPDSSMVERHPRRENRGPNDLRGMTPDQESHLASIIKRFAEACDKKYRAGQAEHGGDLWELSAEALVDNAIDEAIDQVVYLLTLKDRATRLPRF